MRSFRRFLAEAFISPNQGANYGQIIFLVGGAGSGKSTAIRNLIDASKYKTVNPDDVKRLMQKAAKAVDEFSQYLDEELCQFLRVRLCGLMGLLLPQELSQVPLMPVH